tara:strand:+ start:295 stop:825 length:531 start_codon:yes stop_codon:yes gene_type:complete
MTKVLNFLLLAVLISGCSTGNHTDFEANTAKAKEYFLLHQNENAEAMWEYIHPDLNWHMPVYGSEMAGVEEIKNALAGYHAAFEDMQFEADYWLPGVDTETGMVDGSTRTYGTWTAKHTETGKEVSVTSYHSFAFKDGKIIGGGDWFDVGGMMNAINNDVKIPEEDPSEEEDQSEE